MTYDEAIEKEVYELVKKAFSILGVDKHTDEATFKKLSGKYKSYLIEEAKSWTK